MIGRQVIYIVQQSARRIKEIRIALFFYSVSALNRTGSKGLPSPE